MDMELTKDGFLQNLDDWNKEVAIYLAKDLELTDIHWQIIDIARYFYQEYKTTPAVRPLVKLLKEKHGSQFNSATINKAFNSHAIREICRIAGLPKPHRCT